MFNLIKNIFNDISMLYKNFFHFNISKILIYIVSTLYSIVLLLPFIIIFTIIFFIGKSNDLGLSSIFGNNLLLIGMVILGIFTFLLLIISFSYNYVLYTKLYLEYIKGKKLSLSKNYYFNLKLFFNYFKLMILNFIIIISPVILAILLFIILIFISGGINAVTELSSNGYINYFTVLSFVITIVTTIGLFYLMYKTLFSIIILVVKSKGKKFKNSIYYIKESFKFTKGIKKAFSFFTIFILLIIITLPLSITLEYFGNKNDRISDYLLYSTKSSDINLSDPKLFYYIEDLRNEYNGMNNLKLVKELNNSRKIYLFLVILEFLFIYGLFEMMLVSFYIRNIKDKKEKKKRGRPKKNNK